MSTKAYGYWGLGDNGFEAMPGLEFLEEGAEEND